MGCPQSLNDAYIVRLVFYWYSFARDFRVQFEAALQVFYCFFIEQLPFLLFDDDRDELIELMDSVFLIFCALIVFLFYRYSTHYFAFWRLRF